MKKAFLIGLGFVLYLVLFGILVSPSILYLKWLEGSNLGSPLTPFTQIPAEMIAAAAILGATFLFFKYIEKQKFSGLGLGFKQAGRSFFLGNVMGALILFLPVAVLLIAGWLELDWDNVASFELLAALAVGLFFNTVFQEVMFRGYFLQKLLKEYSRPIAILVSSILFVAIHFGVVINGGLNGFIGGLNLFLAGVWLSLAYITTKSLWLPIGIHLGWNFLQAALGFNVSNQNLTGKDQVIVLSGPQVFTGGDYGIEGSLFGLLSLFLGIYILLKWQKKSLGHFFH